MAMALAHGTHPTLVWWCVGVGLGLTYGIGMYNNNVSISFGYTGAHVHWE
jgi:hypothetical protein